MPDERTGTSAWDLFDTATMWLSANMTVRLSSFSVLALLVLRCIIQISTYSLGTLGPSVFFLGLKESCLAILFFNLLSTAPVAYFAIFGPRLGLRQMTIARFSFGYWSQFAFGSVT